MAATAHSYGLSGSTLSSKAMGSQQTTLAGKVIERRRSVDSPGTVAKKSQSSISSAFMTKKRFGSKFFTSRKDIHDFQTSARVATYGAKGGKTTAVDLGGKSKDKVPEKRKGRSGVILRRGILRMRLERPKRLTPIPELDDISMRSRHVSYERNPTPLKDIIHKLVEPIKVTQKRVPRREAKVLKSSTRFGGLEETTSHRYEIMPEFDTIAFRFCKPLPLKSSKSIVRVIPPEESSESMVSPFTSQSLSDEMGDNLTPINTQVTRVSEPLSTERMRVSCFEVSAEIDAPAHIIIERFEQEAICSTGASGFFKNQKFGHSAFHFPIEMKDSKVESPIDFRSVLRK